MDATKIRLSAKEAELIGNADWILTKNEILKKVKHVLEGLMEEQQTHIGYCHQLPAEILVPPPKISRGENYRGLPYLVLDHPRYFDKDNTFAIRTLFWWGNFFSITLHLSGSYKKMYEDKIEASIISLKENSFFIGVNDDQWEHHFETGNYLPLKEMNERDLRMHVTNKEFIKLAKRFPLEQWDDAGEILLASFRQLIGWLTN